MYAPRHFEETRPEVLHELVRSHPFGLLVTQDAHGELAANALPFLLEHDAAGRAVLRGHVARANPLWQAARRDVASLVVFQGPQAYVSPGWYATKAEHGKVVPTWNYVMVQARGRLQVHEDAPWLLSLVTRLTQRHESTLPQPWAVADAPADFVDGLLRAIVGIEIPVDALVGKWKVSQNRSSADREGVAAGLRAQGGDDADTMSRLVQPGA
ncbi:MULTISPECIES: FMN-binding negative transcriptional regulator [unclassified Rhizobacter]|uniref:FMN-binding negative transcriptional regulator n=1 Tax=unclassified Rhizobacter TaxID=2640088 RepID=UPI0006F73B81|nr:MULTISPECIES: FMN-binding negative transcriptional regulator [unclassified Rhizobacter]KQU76787.1 transcriptional regulator [Rhizobacter sp. Root29]KQV97307.1 transcriptional regulator [Rhizobacter sp. Root1238]KRB09979.1 transcriptional regulator [Rhizobacter sp. Root16D2]